MTPAVPDALPRKLDELLSGGTVMLETRKRDGTWVATPVNLVGEHGRAFFRTYDASGKHKRLRNFPHVRIAPCTLLGKVKGPVEHGRALRVAGADADRAAAMVEARFPVLQGRLVPFYHRRKKWTTLYYELILD